MRKRKIPLLVALCVTAAIVYFSIPSPILGNYKKADIWRVELVTDSPNHVDLTDQVNCDKMIQILSNYSKSRVLRCVSPQQMLKGDIEISLMVDDSKSFHIYLSPSDSNSNYIYESAERGGYSICNSDVLQKEISDLLPMDKQLVAADMFRIYPKYI